MQEKINLDHVLEAHALIETKAKNSNDWIKTIILNIHGDFLEVSHVEEYVASVLMIGDTLECRIVNNETITMMNAEVYNIKLASGSIVFKVSSIQTIHNMRKHKRYDVFLRAAFSRKDNMSENYCVVANVSLSGLNIITRNKLNKEDIIELFIKYKKEYFFTIECKVEWVVQSEKNYFCGLSIINMDEKTEGLYGDFINRLQRREQLLKNRLNRKNH